jgi:hypothetical protein
LVLPHQVDDPLEERQQRLVVADAAADHHAGIVPAGQGIRDRALGVGVGGHQAVVGLDALLDELHLAAGDRGLDRRRIPSVDCGRIQSDHQHAWLCHTPNVRQPSTARNDPSIMAR